MSKVEVIITIQPLAHVDGLELHIAAPFTAEDFGRVGAALEPVQAQNARVKLLLLVKNSGMPGPKAPWEDLKLARDVGNLSRVAVLTDIDGYGNLAELESTSCPVSP